MQSIKQKYQNFVTKNKIVNIIDKLLNSIYFPYFIGFLCVLSNFFALEIAFYTIIFIVGTLNLVFCEDTKPILVIILFFQMGMSFKNGISQNPNPELPTIYDNQAVVTYLIIGSSILVISMIFNLIIFNQYQKLFKNSLIILPGLIALFTGYLLGGAFSSYWTIKNFVYNLSHIVPFILIYIYYADIGFKDRKSFIKYASTLMLVTALVIVLQIAFIYLTYDNVIVNGTIERFFIRTGWAVQNSFAGLLVLAIPFIFYLIINEKKKWFYIICLVLSILATIMTLSRNGFLLLGFEAICIIFYLIYKIKVKKRTILISLGAILGISAILIVVFYSRFSELFEKILSVGFGLNGREELYSGGIKNFIEHPIFGSSWLKMIDTGQVLPTPFGNVVKYHNIFIQLLSSCGIFGLLGFLFFFFYITYVCFKNKEKNKLIFYYAFIVLLLGNIFDKYLFDYTFERYLALFLIGMSSYISDKTSPDIIPDKA